jgi:hypothetical protein
MDGNATLTIVTSIPTISRLIQQMASTSRGRVRVTGWVAAAVAVIVIAI